MLGVEDRAAIMAGVNAGLSQTCIAHLIGRSPSVVCREIARHRGPGGVYQARTPGERRRRPRAAPRSGSWTAMRFIAAARLLICPRGARELTDLACEWRESADEEVPEITEKSFARRIELRTIAMDADGSFSAYFDDDDMFFGHCVTAYGTLTDGVTAANMEG